MSRWELPRRKRIAIAKAYEKQSNTCFVCGKPATRRVYTAGKQFGGCREHIPQLLKQSEWFDPAQRAKRGE